MKEEIPKFNISVTIIPISTIYCFYKSQKPTVKMTRYTMEQRARIVEFTSDVIVRLLQSGGITGTFMLLKVLRKRA